MKKYNRRLMFIAATFAIISISALSWAAVEKVEVPLNAMKKHPNASGTAIISDNNISIKAKGLKPNAVYTVWFVNMKPKKHESGAGEPPYMFKTDSYGNGKYTSTLKKSPFRKWGMLMIVLHPNGDPADMKNMVGGLSAKI